MLAVELEVMAERQRQMVKMESQTEVAAVVAVVDLGSVVMVDLVL